MSGEAEDLPPAVMTLAIRSFDVERRTADFVASTDAIDSYEEVVEQSWNLSRYEANPIVLYAHNARELPIGRSPKFGVVNGKLECTIAFASAKANPRAEEVFQLVREEVLRAVSVGFIPGDYRFEKRNGKEVLVLSNNLLLEISVCPIGANPEALAKMRARARKGFSMPTEEEKAAAALRGQIEAKDAELATVRRELGEARTNLAAVTTERDKALKDAKEAVERATAAERRVDERDVDALVGKKIYPTEKEGMMELAATNRPLYEKQLAIHRDKPDLPLTKSITGGNEAATSGKGAPPPTTGNTGNGSALAARFNKGA
jgi:HK97 family phage prohead protease